MDFFGIGPALQGVVRSYFLGGRRSGRTTRLVDSLQDGDRVVFIDSRQADRFKRLCKEQDKEVVCIVIDPKNTHAIFDRGPSQGRTIFDHTWVEQFYVHRLEACQKDLAYLERESSWRGEAHRETQRTAKKHQRRDFSLTRSKNWP